VKTREKKKQLHVYLKKLRNKKTKPKIRKVKQEVIYTHQNGFYPKGTDMKELAQNVINEYKAIREREEALKTNTMSGEEYLKCKRKRKNDRI